MAIMMAAGELRGVAAYEAGDLPKVESWVGESYADVAHLSPDSFTQMRASGTPLLLLDVREPEEFAVSHLPGAAQVDPGIWSSSFLNRYGESVSGRTVVLYCSVGVRSSKLAGRVQAALVARGAKAVYNLQGGVFRWHNEQRVLADGDGETDRVHPYDRSWGKLVLRTDKIATEPRRSVAPSATR
jgi:rhodanese-related sulfurtransferase